MSVLCVEKQFQIKTGVPFYVLLSPHSGDEYHEYSLSGDAMKEVPAELRHFDHAEGLFDIDVYTGKESKSDGFVACDFLYSLPFRVVAKRLPVFARKFLHNGKAGTSGAGFFER